MSSSSQDVHDHTIDHDQHQHYIFNRFHQRIIATLRKIDWRREKEYFNQPDQMFPYYLIASLIISFAIITIRYMTLYDVVIWYQDPAAAKSTSTLSITFLIIHFFWLHCTGNIACYFSILVTLSALGWCYYHKNMIPFSFRLTIWLLVCGSLISSTIIDILFVCPYNGNNGNKNKNIIINSNNDSNSSSSSNENIIINSEIIIEKLMSTSTFRTSTDSTTDHDQDLKIMMMMKRKSDCLYKWVSFELLKLLAIYYDYLFIIYYYIFHIRKNN